MSTADKLERQGLTMTMVEAAVLFGFGVPIVAACVAFVVMACRMQNEENAKLAARRKQTA